jgi:pre-mRNA-splicing factor ATP-dependent RNA helicase DHX15/PRP43
MGTERKRKVSLFDVMEDPSLSSKNTKSNGLGLAAAAGGGSNLINKWNGKAYSQRYFEILEKRRDLPVWLQKDDFLNTLNSNQTLILVGETGSGKTTQVAQAFNFDFGISV